MAAAGCAKANTRPSWSPSLTDPPYGNSLTWQRIRARRVILPRKSQRYSGNCGRRGTDMQKTLASSCKSEWRVSGMCVAAFHQSSSVADRLRFRGTKWPIFRRPSYIIQTVHSRLIPPQTGLLRYRSRYRFSGIGDFPDANHSSFPDEKNRVCPD